MEAVDAPLAKNGASEPSIIVLVLLTGSVTNPRGFASVARGGPEHQEDSFPYTGSLVHTVHTRMSRNYCELVAPRKPFQTARRPKRSLGLLFSWRGKCDVGPNPSALVPIHPGEKVCTPLTHTRLHNPLMGAVLLGWLTELR